MQVARSFSSHIPLSIVSVWTWEDGRGDRTGGTDVCPKGAPGEPGSGESGGPSPRVSPPQDCPLGSWRWAQVLAGRDADSGSFPASSAGLDQRCAEQESAGPSRPKWPADADALISGLPAPAPHTSSLDFTSISPFPGEGKCLCFILLFTQKPCLPFACLFVCLHLITKLARAGLLRFRENIKL